MAHVRRQRVLLHPSPSFFVLRVLVCVSAESFIDKLPMALGRRFPQDDPSNGGAITWSKKYHAVRLHDASTGEVLVPSQRQGISVVYEIWRGQQLVEFTPCDVPFDKNGVYFFTAPKFHRTGTFRLVFHVVPAQFYAAPPPVQAGVDAAPVEKKKGFNIKPLEFHVQVR